MADAKKPDIAYEIAQLRHLYTQLLLMTDAGNPVGLATGLLAPVIRRLERKFP